MAKSNNNAAAVKGQKNLFSFFSKKPTASTAAPTATKEVSSKSTNNNSAAIGAPSKNSNNDTSVTQQQQSAQHQNPTISRTSSNNNNQQPLSSQLNKLLGKVTVGTKLAVYWPDDQEYYPCLVTRHRVKTSAGSEGELYGVIDLFTMLFLFNFSYGVLIHYSLSSVSISSLQ